MSDPLVELPCKQMKLDLPQTGIMDLPNEVLIKIFKCLETESIHQKIVLVCKRFMNISRLPVFCETYSFAIWPKYVNYEDIDDDNEDIEEGYKLDDLCLNRIKKVLKVFPDCKLELCYSNEDVKDEGSIGFFSLVKDLTPFLSSITELNLKFCGRLESSDFSKMIPFANLTSLELEINHDSSEIRYIDVSDLDSTFWNNFPNLTSLKTENSSSLREEVKVRKISVVFTVSITHNNLLLLRIFLNSLRISLIALNHWSGSVT